MDPASRDESLVWERRPECQGMVVPTHETS